MMSKKTKAMEQQLTQLAQENDALRAQLAAAGVEIENVKSELAKTVGERDRFRNELNGAQLDLSNAKRRLDDFRLRQEAIVNALTEAHNTRERILKEANANADRIDAEAKQRRTDILNKAQAFRLQLIFSHNFKCINKPFRAVTHTKPSAVFKQI